MGLFGFLTIVALALVVSLGLRALVRQVASHEWIVLAIALAGGAYMGSEMITATTLVKIQDWGPQFDGLIIIPALLGALVLGLVAEIGLRTEPSLAPAAA